MDNFTVAAGLISKKEREKILNEAHENTKILVEYCKAQKLTPVQLILCCANLLLTYSPFIKGNKVADDIIMEVTAEAMIKIAQDKGIIKLIEIQNSNPEEFLKSFMKNFFGIDELGEKAKPEDIHIPEELKKWTN